MTDTELLKEEFNKRVAECIKNKALSEMPNFSMRNRPREDTLSLLKPMPDISEIKLDVTDIVLSNKKKGCYLRIIETNVSQILYRKFFVGDIKGGWNYFVTGDVPVPTSSFPQAKEELAKIDGCVLFQKHPHTGVEGDEIDLHPLCYFNNTSQADKQIPKLWEWANEW